MIRKVLMSTVAIVAISGTAFAADLPSRRAPPVYVPPPVPLFSWTGFYLGGDVGYAFGRDRATIVNGGGGVVGVVNVGTANGIIGGVHGGYNFSTQSVPVLGQFAGAFSGLPLIGGFGGVGGVVGVEADVDGSDYRGTLNGIGTFEQDRMQLSASVRGRVGIAVDRALFYATGGVAIARFDDTYAAAGVGSTTIAHTRVGYTVGGGIEYAITTQFSLRGEYRYSDFGRYADFNAGLAAAGIGAVLHRQEVQQVKVGFSYKFDNPVAAAPVVARY